MWRTCIRCGQLMKLPPKAKLPRCPICDCRVWATTQLPHLLMDNPDSKDPIRQGLLKRFNTGA